MFVKTKLTPIWHTCILFSFSAGILPARENKKKTTKKLQLQQQQKTQTKKQTKKATQPTNNQTNKKPLNLRKEKNSVQAKGISDSPRRKTPHEESCFKKQGH